MTKENEYALSALEELPDERSIPIMKKGRDSCSDEMRPEYDLSKLKGMVQGKYYKRVLQGTNLIRLDPDVADIFPDSRSVNEALRTLARIARKSPRRVGRSRPRQA